MCECGDKLCPVHIGENCELVGTIILYRIDMDDETGVLFCDECADDAMDSGVFTTREPIDDDELLDDIIELCPIDNGVGLIMGVLGNKTYYRCESCGMEFST